MRFAVIGLDHRHIYHMVEGLLSAGASCAGYDPATSDPRVLAGFEERFPNFAKVTDRKRLLEDASVDVVLCAAIPSDRSAIAIEAMEQGKDVMVDKPGVTSFDQLRDVEQAVHRTRRIFSICFSERFVVPATIVVEKLIAAGAIGRIVQTIGMGPHRLNRGIRPAWFFETETYGGILTDIASHQIDQFLHFTGSRDAEIVAASVGHFGDDVDPSFQDFGDILLRSPQASGYVRVDWFTADGLPTWGDGRLFVLGTEGTIEIRKYVDIAGRSGTDHVFVVDGKGTRHIDASREPLVYFDRFAADVRDRTETAMRQDHVFTVCRLALQAQAQAVMLKAGQRPQ